jgi:hypothetical protein
VAATEQCEVGYATGSAGDVYLCHPFLVHAAQANHGSRPRFIGQPGISANHPYRLDRPDPECSPVELAIKQGLRVGSHRNLPGASIGGGPEAVNLFT